MQETQQGAWLLAMKGSPLDELKKAGQVFADQAAEIAKYRLLAGDLALVLSHILNEDHRTDCDHKHQHTYECGCNNRYAAEAITFYRALTGRKETDDGHRENLPSGQ